MFRFILICHILQWYCNVGILRLHPNLYITRENIYCFCFSVAFFWFNWCWCWRKWFFCWWAPNSRFCFYHCIQSFQQLDEFNFFSKVILPQLCIEFFHYFHFFRILLRNKLHLHVGLYSYFDAQWLTSLIFILR